MKTLQNNILSKLFAAEEKFKQTPRLTETFTKARDSQDDKVSQRQIDENYAALRRSNNQLLHKNNVVMNYAAVSVVGCQQNNLPKMN